MDLFAPKHPTIKIEHVAFELNMKPGMNIDIWIGERGYAKLEIATDGTLIVSNNDEQKLITTPWTGGRPHDHFMSDYNDKIDEQRAAEMEQQE